MDPTASGPTADEPESGAAPELWGQPGAVGPARGRHDDALSPASGRDPGPESPTTGPDPSGETPLGAPPSGEPGGSPDGGAPSGGTPSGGTPTTGVPPSGVAPEVWGQPGAVGPARGERDDPVGPAPAPGSSTAPAPGTPTAPAPTPGVPTATPPAATAAGGPLTWTGGPGSDAAVVPHGGETADDLATWTALSPQVMVLWRLSYATVAAIVLIIVSLVAGASDTMPDALRLGLPAAVLVVAVVAIAVIPRAEYRRWKYLVTDDGIELRHGLVVHHESSIPHFRVQHVDVRQGVLQRALKVVTLSISTASPATDAELPAVDPARAELIRARVLDRAEADDGV